MSHITYTAGAQTQRRTSHPRLLVLASRFPYPVLGGDRLRVYNFLKILARHYDVDFLSLHPTAPSNESLSHIGSFLHRVHCFPISPVRSAATGAFGAMTRNWPLQVGYYHSRPVASWVRKNAGEYDAVFCFHVRMTEYAAELPSKKLVDLVDAISMNYTLALESTPEAHWRLIYRFEIPRLLGYERSVVATFDRSILISEVDRSFLAERGADRTKMAVVPNGTDLITAGGSGEMSEDMDVLFHGNMVTQANRAAAMYFLQDVLPLLRQSGSSPGVYIVGTSPSAKLRNMADGQNIRVTGEVADVTRYLLRSKVVVAPMVFGAGVQNKILEAMAVGKPVVTTSLGAEGIDGRSGEHFIVADSPAEFAAATKRLLEDPALRASLGMAGRKLIREKYTWDTSGRRLLEEVASVLPSPTLQYRDSHFTKGVSS